MNSKEIGNRKERGVSKELSLWFFNDPKILYKESSSGGRKHGFKGDVFVYDSEKFNEHWTKFPFCIEVKNGYGKHKPTFENFNIIKEWLLKLLNNLDERQIIPILITQFKGSRTPLFITNIVFNIWSDIMIVIKNDDIVHYFYIYKYKELLDYDFYHILPVDFLELFVQDKYLKVRKV